MTTSVTLKSPRRTPEDVDKWLKQALKNGPVSHSFFSAPAGYISSNHTLGIGYGGKPTLHALEESAKRLGVIIEPTGKRGGNQWRLPNTQSQKSNVVHLDKKLIHQLAAVQQEISQHSRIWTENKIKAGRILLRLREGVPHGEWEPQLAEICKMAKIGRSTAHNYMNLAEGKAVKADTKRSKNGYPLDELRSYLHKSLRTADEEAAMRCAVELSISGKDESTWRLLKDVFPCEDVGLARIGLLAEIDALYKSWKKTKNDSRFHAYRLPLTHAVLLLCRVQKSRLVDDALTFYFNAQESIQIPAGCKENAAKAFETPQKIVVPDFAKDRHTAAGRKMGRKGRVGIDHFYDKGATLKNETTQSELINNYGAAARQALHSRGAK